MADLTDFQRNVDESALKLDESEGRMRGSLKSLFFNAQFIVADRQLRNTIETRGVRNGRIGDAALHGFDGDGGAYDSSAARIRNGSVDGSGDILSQNAMRPKRKKDEHGTKKNPTKQTQSIHKNCSPQNRLLRAAKQPSFADLKSNGTPP